MTKSPFTTLTLLLMSSAVVAGNCFNEGEKVTLSGRLSRETFPGPPNYESVARGDEPQIYWIVTTTRPICISEAGKEDATKTLEGVPTKRMQLLMKREDYASKRALVDQVVVIEGRLTAGNTGHHNTPVMVEVQHLQGAGDVGNRPPDAVRAKSAQPVRTPQRTESAGRSIAAQSGDTAWRALSFQGVGPTSSEQQFRKVFAQLSCKPVGGLEMLDISCKGPAQIGKISTDVTASIWKEAGRFQLYQLDFRIGSSYEKDVLSALTERFGSPKTKPAASKYVMNVRFFEPAEYTWQLAGDQVRLIESTGGDPAFLHYLWSFTPEETAHRRARIDTAKPVTLTRPRSVQSQDFK